MNQELGKEICRTSREVQVAIDSASKQLDLRKKALAITGGDLVRDAGVNFRLGQLDALKWVLAIEGTTLEDAVKLHLMTNKIPALEGEQTDG